MLTIAQIATKDIGRRVQASAVYQALLAQAQMRRSLIWRALCRRNFHPHPGICPVTARCGSIPRFRAAHGSMNMRPCGMAGLHTEASMRQICRPQTARNLRPPSRVHSVAIFYHFC